MPLKVFLKILLLSKLSTLFWCSHSWLPFSPYKLVVFLVHGWWMDFNFILEFCLLYLWVLIFISALPMGSSSLLQFSVWIFACFMGSGNVALRVLVGLFIWLSVWNISELVLGCFSVGESCGGILALVCPGGENDRLMGTKRIPRLSQLMNMEPSSWFCFA